MQENNNNINVQIRALSFDNVSVQYKTKILANNIVGGINVLTQEMINQPNTKYVIRCDYALGENITIPESCILYFDGGSIYNIDENFYSITGKETAIIAPIAKIFDTSIVIAGTWNIDNSYPEWFGAKGDDITDDRLAIQKCIDCFYRIFFCDKSYICSCSNGIGLNIPGNRCLIGNHFKNYSSRGSSTNCIKFINLQENDVCINVVGYMFTMCNIQLCNREQSKLGTGIKIRGLGTNLSFNINIDHVKVNDFAYGARIAAFLGMYKKFIAYHCGIGMQIDGIPGETVDVLTSNHLQECYFDINDTGLIINSVYSSLINCAFDNHTLALHVGSHSKSLQCIQTSFEGNKQAILCNASVCCFKGIYVYQGTGTWSSYEEASDFMKFTGEANIIEDLDLRLVDDGESAAVRLDSNFKCIKVVSNNDYQRQLTIKNQFNFASWVTTDTNPRLVFIERILYAGFLPYTHENIQRQLTNQITTSWINTDGKLLYWNGSNLLDALGNTIQ